MVPFNAQTLLLNLQTCIVHVDFQEKGITEISLHYQLSSQKSIFHFKDSLPRHLMAGPKKRLCMFSYFHVFRLFERAHKNKGKNRRKLKNEQGTECDLVASEGIILFRVCLLFCFDMQSYPEGIPVKRNLFLVCTWTLASLFAFCDIPTMSTLVMHRSNSVCRPLDLALNFELPSI